MSSEMAKTDVAALYRVSTDVAGVCREIVTKTAQAIQGRKYVRVEGWQAIATAHGCVAGARDVEAIDGGLRAIGEIRRISDGVVLATAEGFVGDDEKTWASRPMFARRAMAQTRAISRVCRSAFAHVVVLIDANLSTTPAEEMDAIEAEVVARRATPPEPRRASPKMAAVVARVVQHFGATDEPPPPGDDDAPPDFAPSPPRAAPAPQPREKRAAPNMVAPYGSSKGKAPAELSDKDLEWYASAAAKAVDDPTKGRYRADNLAWLEALRDEQARRAE